MKHWRNSFRLLKYGFKIKAYITGAIIFFAMGMLTFRMEGAAIMGTIYIALAFVYLVQLPVRLEASGLVASSTKRKMFGIHFPNIIVGTGMFLACLIIQLILNREEEFGELLLWIYLMLFVIQLMVCVSNRLLALVVLLYAGLMVGSMMLILSTPVIPDIDIDIAVANRLGILLVIIGVVLSSVLRRLAYPLPISKVIINGTFQKQR